MTECIFKTTRYDNGCVAQDGKVECSEKCAFYKTREMQEISLAIAEERYERRYRTKSPRKRWTREEEIELLKSEGENQSVLAKRYGVTSQAIYQKIRALKKKGEYNV